MLIYYTSGLKELNQEIEGVGAIYTQHVLTYLICKFYKIEFIHHIHQIGHNYNNESNWDKLWDDFFNYKSLCKTINDINLNDYKEIRKLNLYKEDIEKDKNNNCIYYCKGTPLTNDEYNMFHSLDKTDIIKAYNDANINRTLIYNKNKKNIAIHIRVWNECDTAYYNGYITHTCDRYKYNEFYYLELINKLINKYPDYDIHIFTQESFKERYSNIFNNPKFNCHINMNSFDSLHHMINADVLVLGLSAFSRLAGFYNNNTIIYTDKNDSSILTNWIYINEL